jgi:aryl-alcohol dehydrogenase-like predicted oxidoreductase
MRYRRLGRTNLEVSEIGFGAWGIGKGWWGHTEDTLSIQALLRAFELGVNFIDTAYGYGDGHSERLIAEAMKAYRERMIVATKIPLKTRDWPPKPDTPAKEGFPGAWIIEHTEKSLRHLQTDCMMFNSFTFGEMNGSKKPSGARLSSSSSARERFGFLECL